MKVETVITKENKTRYMLVDDVGEPVTPVLKFLKYKDNAGRARETLQSYCYALKHFFEFLKQKDYDYRDVGIDEMAEFVRWLQTPYRNVRVATITPCKNELEPRTVNIYISLVLQFYDYLMRQEDYSIQLSQKLKKQMPGSRRQFKDFLYHINKNKEFDVNPLKLKVPKKRPKTLSKEQVTTLINACSNLRDEFLIHLLFESGFRIGECLSLWLEDFKTDQAKIDLKDRGELPNFAEIKTVNSPRKIDVSADLMNMFSDYIAEYHTDEVDTNHVFIKISGENIYQPMEYPDVTSLFNRLFKKTGIYATPHMFRHIHFNNLRKIKGWGWEKIKERGGWANVQTPINIYSHVDEEEMTESWKRAEDSIKIKRQNLQTSSTIDDDIEIVIEEQLSNTQSNKSTIKGDDD